MRIINFLDERVDELGTFLSAYSSRGRKNDELISCFRIQLFMAECPHNQILRLCVIDPICQ